MNPAAEKLASDAGDAFAVLKRDHEVVKNLVAELVQPGDRTLRRTMLNRLKTALAIHNATEESLIYPATKCWPDARTSRSGSIARRPKPTCCFSK